MSGLSKILLNTDFGHGLHDFITAIYYGYYSDVLHLFNGAPTIRRLYNSINVHGWLTYVRTVMG